MSEAAQRSEPEEEPAEAEPPGEESPRPEEARSPAGGSEEKVASGNGAADDDVAQVARLAEARQRIIEQVKRIVHEEFPQETNDHGRAAEVTGFFVLLTYLIDSLLADQWLAFAVACAGIGLMMLIAFRNPLYALVALVPNVLPIVIVTGLLGWSGLKINMGAAMIAAVSMGLSIDSSIHYITSFQRARREGKNVATSLGTVHQSVGRAMVFSTLALIAGFIVLCFSDFIPTVYFGALVSLTMLGGLAGNLLVLPLLLKLATRDKT